jgi:hypothetical protein
VVGSLALFISPWLCTLQAPNADHPAENAATSSDAAHPPPNESKSFSITAEQSKKMPNKKQKPPPFPEEWQDYFYLDGSVKF